MILLFVAHQWITGGDASLFEVLIRGVFFGGVAAAFVAIVMVAVQLVRSALQ
ncbi:hypothetical protein [Halomarina oriensis]|uniref:Uncharacterized protein n=1 Tax=Halomarina oriensis TaxID=671145 RepID=A0A6B0GUL1_9EURY|nr:hypothetical protein [Halomarina oriensis]MWG35408.1 hypothetical protein [Halomarina oriensis]